MGKGLREEPAGGMSHWPGGHTPVWRQRAVAKAPSPMPPRDCPGLGVWALYEATPSKGWEVGSPRLYQVAPLFLLLQ